MQVLYFLEACRPILLSFTEIRLLSNVLQALIVILFFLFDDDLICATDETFLCLITLFSFFGRSLEVLLSTSIFSTQLVEVKPFQNLRASSHLLRNQLLTPFLEALQTGFKLVGQLSECFEFDRFAV